MAGEKTIPDKYAEAPVTSLSRSAQIPLYQDTVFGGGVDSLGSGVALFGDMIEQESVVIGNTTRTLGAEDKGKILVLNHANAAWTMNATTLAAGWWATIWLLGKGAAYTIPTPTGGTLNFGKNAGTHSKASDKGVVTIQIVDVSGTLYVLVTGDTEA